MADVFAAAFPIKGEQLDGFSDVSDAVPSAVASLIFDGHELLNAPVKDFNRALAERGIDREHESELRRLRRQEKNKSAAKRCREKKTREHAQLTQRVAELEAALKARAQSASADSQRAALAESKCLALERDVAKLTAEKTELASRLALAEAKFQVELHKLQLMSERMMSGLMAPSIALSIAPLHNDAQVFAAADAKNALLGDDIFDMFSYSATPGDHVPSTP
eukprot:Opistho-1_new@38847